MGRLATAIDELAAIDPTSLGDVELHELVVELALESSRLAAARAGALAAWDARRVWAADGSKSASARFARECDLSARTARSELERARKLRSMPETAAALRDGKVSVDQADLLAHVNQPDVAALFARDESLLLAQIHGLRFVHGVRAAKYWLQLAQEEAGHTPESVRRDGRHLSAARTIWGTVDLRGTLDTLAGTEFLDELRRLERTLFEADWATARLEHGTGAAPEQLARTAGQRRADALVEMARRSRRAPADGPRPRPLITVLAGYGAFSRTCELADGTVIAPGDVVPLLAEADIERVVFDGPSRVIEVGVRRRFFEGALRRAIEVRDRHCQHPSGCDVPAAECQIDHIVPYADGGLTTQDNGRCYCPAHNRRRVGEPAGERAPPEP
jgi:hypothetical protein